MDILTDILNTTGLDRTMVWGHSFYTPQAIAFPCVRSMGFHAVTQGVIEIISAELKEPLRLKRGDLVLMRRGFHHTLTTDANMNLKVQSVQELVTDLPTAKQDSPLATVISGAYLFQSEPRHPFFKEIPDCLILRDEDVALDSPLYLTKQLLATEIQQSRPGSDSIRRHLMDLTFHYLLRRWIENYSHVNGSWSLAFKDTQLLQAMSVIHGQYMKSWDIESLAQVAGVSRTTFSQKFKKVTGTTPANYLAHVRIERAADILRKSDQSLDAVAGHVGYTDPFSFSKAFKRLKGISPQEFRKQQIEAAKNFPAGHF
jgi:AraC-like DNA-binding protein